MTAQSTRAGNNYCVVGSPISHSRSPQIHHAFGLETGISLEYTRLEVAAGTLARAVEDFRKRGGSGLNVTVPLKEEAHEYCASVMPRAQRAGAVNTIWFDEAGHPIGDNTDGVGLVTDLQANCSVALKARHILLVGAGGAAKGVVPMLLDAGPDSLTITNRTERRAADLAAGHHTASSAAISVLAWGEAPRTPPDVIINATALSLEGQTPPLSARAMSNNPACYDMMYQPEPTAFMRWAEQHGAVKTYDGLGMLVEQAAEAFFLWHGVRPATAPVISAIRDEMRRT